MAPSRPACPRRPGAPGPTRFRAKKRDHQGDHNEERGTKPCLNFPTHGMLKIPEINTSRPRPQSADSWDSRARLDSASSQTTPQIRSPIPRPSPKFDHEPPRDPRPSQVPPCSPTACEARDPGSVPPPPRGCGLDETAHLALPGLPWRPEAAPQRTCAAALLEASGGGGALTSRCCGRHGCAS